MEHNVSEITQKKTTARELMLLDKDYITVKCGRIKSNRGL